MPAVPACLAGRRCAAQAPGAPCWQQGPLPPKPLCMAHAWALCIAAGLGAESECCTAAPAPPSPGNEHGEAGAAKSRPHAPCAYAITIAKQRNAVKHSHALLPPPPPPPQIDLLYLHNAGEMQLVAVGKARFFQRLLEAFTACEQLRAAGFIRQASRLACMHGGIVW